MSEEAEYYVRCRYCGALVVECECDAVEDGYDGILGEG